MIEFEIWMEWRDRQWERPDRTDHYLMQIASEVTRSYARHPGRVKMQNYRVKFSPDESQPKPVDLKKQTMLAQARWVGLMGTGVTVVKPLRPGEGDSSS